MHCSIIFTVFFKRVIQADHEYIYTLFFNQNLINTKYFEKEL